CTYLLMVAVYLLYSSYSNQYLYSNICLYFFSLLTVSSYSVSDIHSTLFLQSIHSRVGSTLHDLPIIISNCSIFCSRSDSIVLNLNAGLLLYSTLCNSILSSGLLTVLLVSLLCTLIPYSLQYCSYSSSRLLYCSLSAVNLSSTSTVYFSLISL